MLTLHQSGNSLTGSFSSHGDGLCVFQGDAYEGAVGAGSITGDVAGSMAQLKLSPTFSLTVTISDDSLTGNQSRKLTFAGSSVVTVTTSGPLKGWRLPSSLPAGAAEIVLTPDLPIVPQGDSVLMTASVRNVKHQVLNGAPVDFSVIDPTQASASTAGWIRGLGQRGLFKIIARSGAAYAEAVALIQARPHLVQATPQSVAMNRTHKAQIRVTVLDYVGAPIAGSPITYSTSDPSIVSVSSSGLVTSLGPLGETEVLVSTGGVADTVPVSIVAIPMSGAMSPPTAVLPPGGSQQLDVQVRDSAGIVISNQSVVYTSANPSLISVSPSGLATSLGPQGFTDITATFDTFSLSSRILVRSGSLPQLVGTTQVGGLPSGLAVSSTGAMYVGDVLGAGLARGDLPSFTLPVRLPVGGQITGLAFDPTGARLYMAHDSLNRVAVLDVATNQVIDSIDVQDAGGVAVSPDGQKLLIGTPSGIHLYDALSLTSLGFIPTELAIHFTFHPTLPLVYASVGTSVLEINLNTVTVTQTFDVGTVPQATAIDPNGTELYVAHEAGFLQIWDRTTGQTTRIVPLGNNLFGLAVSPVQDLIYVAYEYAGRVGILDRASRVELAQIQVGGTPRRIVLDQSRTTAIVVNQGGWVDFIQ
jgi:YVTN family beta-propeller protein